jgi:hypothetical protein
VSTPQPAARVLRGNTGEVTADPVSPFASWPSPPYADLPDPVTNWLGERYPDGVPAVDTVVLAGWAQARPGGRATVQAEARVALELGRQRVLDLRGGIGRLTFARIVDAYVDGRGVSGMGKRRAVGPTIDAAGAVAMFADSLIYPASWSRLDGLSWGAVDASCATVSATVGGHEVGATVSFDDEAGDPATLQCDRARDRDEPPVPWLVTWSNWFVGGAVAAPGRTEVQWLDRDDPWLRLRVERVETDVDLHADLKVGRTALTKAGG